MQNDYGYSVIIEYSNFKQEFCICDTLEEAKAIQSRCLQDDNIRTANICKIIDACYR